MKYVIQALIVFVSMLTSSAFAEVAQPSINVGSSWTYRKIDGYNNQVSMVYKNIVGAVTATGYDIVRLDEQGAVLERYQIGMNLGRIDATGGGNLYRFPLVVGQPKWTVRSEFVNDTGKTGFDEVTYQVVGETTVTVPAGTFSVMKVRGEGFREFSDNRGKFLSISEDLYYAPEARSTVKIEKTVRPARGNPSFVRHEMTAYELK